MNLQNALRPILFAAVALSFAINEAALIAATINTISLRTNDLIYDPISGRLFASVPSSAGVPNGNSIVSINPFTGAVGSPVFVGSEPGKLAVSDNGQYLYVGLGGAAQVRRVNLTTMTADLQFSLGSDTLGPYYAEDIEVLPGLPNSIAVSRRNIGFSPRHEGVAIYDNGVKRPVETPGHTGSNVIEFAGSASILYGYNNETTDFGFRTMAINANGVTITNDASNIISNFGVDIEAEGSRIYSTSGRVVDPLSSTLLGTFNTSGVIEPDAFNNKMFILAGNNIVPFNLTTFVPLGGNLAVPGINGNPSDLVRFGSNGLAFRTSGDQVFLIRDPVLVPEPSGILLATAGVAFIITRRRRQIA